MSRETELKERMRQDFLATKYMKNNLKTIAKAYVEATKLANVKTAARNTGELLSKRNMLGKEKEILEEVARIWNEEKGIVEATIRSRYPLHESQKHKIIKTLKQKFNCSEVLPHYVQDDALLGGVKITVKDEVIDGTILNKIRQLKSLITSAY